MADNGSLTLQANDSDLGKIKISPQVLEIISGIASTQVKGVHSMASSISTSVNELFGRKDLKKGIKLTFADKKLIVDIYVYLDYGVSVPKVALEIQEKVKQQLLFMTELNVGAVNVHVEGIVHP